MFTEWDFLLAEIWGLLALAGLAGLVAGWLIWGGRSGVGPDADDVRRLRAQLDREQAKGRAIVDDPLDDIPAMQGGGYVRPSKAPRDMAAQPLQPVSPLLLPANNKPGTLTGPRDGLPDDLTKINGIGAKMAALCNNLGFWHYDQIAAWNADEIAWVDENLEGFHGRVSRDNWVAQARKLAGDTTPATVENETPAFVRRKD